MGDVHQRRNGCQLIPLFFTLKTRILEPSWDSVGGGAPGRSWGHIGAFLGPSWGILGPIWSNPEASVAHCQRKRENAYTAEWRDGVVIFCLLGGLLERFRGDLNPFSCGLLPLAGMMGSILSHLGLCCVILQVFVASQAIAESSGGKYGRSNASRLNRQNTVFATESGLTSWGTCAVRARAKT